MCDWVPVVGNTAGILFWAQLINLSRISVNFDFSFITFQRGGLFIFSALETILQSISKYENTILPEQLIPLSTFNSGLHEVLIGVTNGSNQAFKFIHPNHVTRIKWIQKIVEHKLSQKAKQSNVLQDVLSDVSSQMRYQMC